MTSCTRLEKPRRVSASRPDFDDDSVSYLDIDLLAPGSIAWIEAMALARRIRAGGNALIAEVEGRPRPFRLPLAV